MNEIEITKRKFKVLNVSAKCSDMCSIWTYNTEDNFETKLEHDGYVLDGLGIGHNGNYIDISIDIETGQIINWPKLTDKNLEEIFKNR